MTPRSADLLRELEWRGFVQQATPGLDAHLGRGPVTAYCGFDPTAPSLQLGNLMPLMLLAQLQRHGHRPIVLMGGGTGLIGDPSGKRGERPLLSKEQIRENLQRQRDQMARFLEFGAGKSAALLLDNAKWLVAQGLIDFLRDVGKHFTVNVMLQKESVQARLETGLSYTEFSYMLLQAYDFLHLYRERQCTLQVGGSDQWGNITAGVDLIRRVENAEAHGLVAPLVTMASGQKFGKSETGAIYLDPAMTSPYKFYQFWINVDDRDVESYLKLFTLKSKAEIEELMAQQSREPAARAAQRALASDVTTRVHGKDIAAASVSASAILFGDIAVSTAITDETFAALEGEIPTMLVPGSSADISLIDVVVQTGLAKSKNEARRAIEQGGIYVNEQRVDDAARKIGPEDWIRDRHVFLRKGKKAYALLRREG
jgi:tyrosyl-tRNA synthetase